MIQNFLRDLRLRYRNSGLDALFAPRKPRQPLVRFAFGLVGLALLALLLVAGAFLGTAMVLGSLLLRLARRRPPSAPQARRGALDGEFRVIDRHALR